MPTRAEVQQWFDQGRDIESILASVAQMRDDPARTTLLRRCALVRSFDKKLLDGALAADLKIGSYDDFLCSPEVLRSAVTPGQYSIKESARTQYLTWWALQENAQELNRFSAVMLEHLQRPDRNARPTDALAFRAILEPQRAAEDFRRMYAAADQKSDFAECESVLNCLRWYGVLLPSAVLNILSDRERYFNSRVMFADDWARTERFIERPEVHEQFQDFWRDNSKWIFHVYGKGGSGKTAYLRWLTARRCVVEDPNGQTIPVAKIDMDFVNLPQLTVAPWLILLPIARQLDVQLPNRPFYSPLGSWLEFAPLLDRYRTGATEWLPATTLDNFITDFGAGLGDATVLIIFDTLEELVLRHASSLGAVLQFFSAVRAKHAGLRIVLSGRFHLRERAEVADVVMPFQPVTTAVSLSQFTKSEATRYLTEVRALRGEQYDVAAIVRQSNRMPFKLALYADLAIAKGRLTRQDVVDLGDVELAYLIDRIIERIPDEEMPLRWLLRYAVIPRGGNVTFDFADKVLRRYLEDEMRRRGMTLLDNADPGTWKTVTGTYTLDKIWDDLLRYRSESGWISITDGRPVLQPEIVVPMRTLLGKEAIFRPLHGDAARYFESFGSRGEAAYHHFWAEGPAAAQYWRNSVHEADTLQHAIEIASLVCGSDLLDDDGEPLPHGDYGRVIDETSVIEGYFERAALEIRMNLLEYSIDALDKAEADLKQVLRREEALGSEVIPPERRALVEAAVAAAHGGVDNAIAILDSALGRSRDDRDIVAMCVMRARLSPDLGRSAELLEQAIALSGKDAHPAFPVSWLWATQGKRWFDNDNLEDADSCYRMSLSACEKEGAPEAQFLTCLQTLILIARSCLRYSEAEKWILYAANSLRGRNPEVQRFVGHHRLQLRLDRGELEAARSEVSVAVSSLDRVPRQNELWADITAAAEEYPEADNRYRATIDQYRRANDEEKMIEASLKRARMLLEGQGDLGTVLESRIRSGRWTLPLEIIRGELQILRLVKSGKMRDAAELWADQFRRTKNQPRSEARWASLGIALRISSLDAVPRWLSALQRVRPGQARLPLLDPFRHWDGDSIPVSSDMTRGLMQLFPRPDGSDPDYVYQALAVAPAIACLGGKDAAASTILEALMKAAPPQILIRRKLLMRAIAFELVVPDQQLWSLIEQTADRKTRLTAVYGVMRIELAEYWWKDGQLDSVRRVLDGYDFDSLKNSQYEFRLYRLRSALDASRDPQASADLFNRATSVAAQLGWPSPSKLEGVSVGANPPQAAIVPECEQLIIEAEPPENPKRLSMSWHRPGRGPSSSKSSDLPFPGMFSDGTRTGATDGWEKPAEGIARLRHYLPSAFVQGLTRAVRRDAVITTPEGPLASLPWEAAMERTNFRFVYRTPNSQLPEADTVTWLQTWLASHNIPTPIDGIAGPQTLEGLATAAASFGILADGWDGVETKRRMRQTLNPQRTLAVMPMLVSGKSGYSRYDVPLEKIYGDHKLRVFPYELMNPDPPSVDPSGCFIHIPLDFVDAREGVALNNAPQFFRLEAAQFERNDVITAEQLGARLGNMGRPFVLLDPPHPGHPREWAKQLLLRNQFAHDLLANGFARAVLAAGLVEPSYERMSGQLNDFLSRLVQFACAGELVAAAPQFSTLFCWDPTIPAI